jgi:hypothetical protein
VTFRPERMRAAITRLRAVAMADPHIAALSRMSPTTRQAYEKHQATLSKWHAGFDTPSGAYEACLADKPMPEPPKCVRAAFGEPPPIYGCDSDEQAAEKYRQFAFGD